MVFVLFDYLNVLKNFIYYVSKNYKKTVSIYISYIFCKKTYLQIKDVQDSWNEEKLNY